MANAANQSISFPLVEHSAKIEAARLLAYRALAANDAGRDAGTDAIGSAFGSAGTTRSLATRRPKVAGPPGGRLAKRASGGW